MVQAAILGAGRVTQTIAKVVAALEQIEAARKNVEKLRKAGMPTQANALERDCDRAEKGVKASITREVARRAKARTRARRASRTSAGRFG